MQVEGQLSKNRNWGSQGQNAGSNPVGDGSAQNAFSLRGRMAHTSAWRSACPFRHCTLFVHLVSFTAESHRSPALILREGASRQKGSYRQQVSGLVEGPPEGGRACAEEID
jgi:hypothetical protein